MTSQAQGKGKKKNKDVIKVSLDEFNQIDAPHGHSVVNLKMTGLDWAETMAADQQSADTHIIVPALPRAQRGPNIDLDDIPDEGPFRASLFNLPMSIEEKEVERFLSPLNVIRVEISKASTTVELASKEDLYEVLCKDGTNFKGRTTNICLYGQEPRNSYGSDRYGGRGSNSSYGDRYGDRNQGFGSSRPGDRYGDRSGGGGFNRDRDNYSGFNRNAGAGGGFGAGGQRGGYGLGDRYSDRGNFRDSNRGQYTSGGGEPVSEEPTDWRARPTVKPPPPAPSSYNNGSRQPYPHSRNEQASNRTMTSPQHQQYQSDPYYQSRSYQQHNPSTNNSPYSHYGSQAGSNRPPSSATNEERPKLVLQKRKTPLNPDDLSSVSRNEAIFGKAKPSSTPYQKMNEVEEKLKGVQITEGKDANDTKTDQ